MVSYIKIEGKRVKGIFKERPNRFLARVTIKGRLVSAFLPDPGRLWELLTPNTEVILRKILKKDRKTNYDLIAVVHAGKVVSVDSRVPNRLILEALKNKEIKELAEYTIIKGEPSYGNSRFDFLLSTQNQRCFLEVKSCTLVKDAVALFPDAPTERGRRHLMELVKAKHDGYRACVLFLIQRTDAEVFSPNDTTDPAFGRALRYAAAQGVEVYAYSSQVIHDQIILKGEVKVDMHKR